MKHYATPTSKRHPLLILSIIGMLIPPLIVGLWMTAGVALIFFNKYHPIPEVLKYFGALSFLGVLVGSLPLALLELGSLLTMAILLDRKRRQQRDALAPPVVDRAASKPLTIRGRLASRWRSRNLPWITLCVIGSVTSLLVLVEVTTWNQRRHLRAATEQRHLTELYQNYHDYYLKHRDPPPQLAAIVWNTLGSHEDLLRSTDDSFPHKLPMTIPTEDWPQYGDAVDAESDFRYIGAYPCNGIVMYSKASVLGGRAVLFTNGSVRRVPNSELNDLFAKANAARENIYMFKPLVLDEPDPGR